MTDKKTSPSRTADQFIVRFPEGMRDRIAELAKQHGRSMNAEIVMRLEWALSVAGPPTKLDDIPTVSGDIPWSMAQDIARLAADSGVGFDEMLARIFVAGLNPDGPMVMYLPVLPGASSAEFKAVLRAAGDFVRPDITIVSEKIKRWSSVASHIASQAADEK